MARLRINIIFSVVNRDKDIYHYFQLDRLATLRPFDEHRLPAGPLEWNTSEGPLRARQHDRCCRAFSFEASRVMPV